MIQLLSLKEKFTLSFFFSAHLGLLQASIVLIEMREFLKSSEYVHFFCYFLIATRCLVHYLFFEFHIVVVSLDLLFPFLFGKSKRQILVEVNLFLNLFDLLIDLVLETLIVLSLLDTVFWYRWKQVWKSVAARCDRTTKRSSRTSWERPTRNWSCGGSATCKGQRT